MTMQDPLADMLTRIRNAQQAKIGEVSMPSSRIKMGVAGVLKEEGYIDEYSLTEGDKPQLKIKLKYYRGKAVIENIKRISRPGLRQYRSSHDIPTIKGGLGVVILSTNKGVISDKAARAAGVGGELICSVF
ncbi:MAG: 30S ribosomal protein S8 [Gammaproteobacteria bacterium]|nr:30S ribosomal protein S8 [Gammaproteobacteria bacterium]